MSNDYGHWYKYGAALKTWQMLYRTQFARLPKRISLPLKTKALLNLTASIHTMHFHWFTIHCSISQCYFLCMSTLLLYIIRFSLRLDWSILTVNISNSMWPIAVFNMNAPVPETPCMDTLISWETVSQHYSISIGSLQFCLKWFPKY